MSDYSFSTADKILKIATKNNISLGEVVLQSTMLDKGIDEETAKAQMQTRLTVMREAIAKGLLIEKRSASGLSGGDAKRLKEYQENKIAQQTALVSETVLQALTYSFAIMEHNARFGRIVAFPTAGSAGTVPGALLATQEKLEKDDDAVIMAMFTAAGIGIIVAENASLAGATGGCQAEVGSAGAMAAAAITELRGGTPKQALTAAAVCLKGMLGLVCDPIGGLVESPCVKRNATAIANAFMASEISMAGVESNVSFDEVIVAMRNISQLMAMELKETAKGGLAITKTGLRVACSLNK